MQTENTQTTLDEQINDSIREKDKEQILRSGCIMASLDMEQAFKLYSYRIISHDDFVERVKEVAQTVISL